MLTINIKGDLRPLQRAFQDFRAKQVPFATAHALTALAKGVQAAERAEIASTFDSPTPFTLNSIALTPATKARQVATVYPKEVAAAYLAPYVVGGNREYGNKKGFIAPVNVPTNQYGNIPRGTLKRYKGKPGVFIGSIRFRKTGKTVSGVWQRGATPRGTRYKGDGGYGTRGKNTNMVHGVRTTLTLLMEFQDTTPVRKNLDFYGRANAYLRKHAAEQFRKSMALALSSAKR